MKTLVIASHPYPGQSRVIKALQQTAVNAKNVTVRNLETLYGSHMDGFDIREEQNACENADRIVYLFPLHWFNLTPMLKAYLNEVWAYGWAFGPGGNALRNKEMLVVTSAGASEHAYSAEGSVRSTINDVLTPMKASALYVGMKYLEPLVLYNAAGTDDKALNEFCEKLAGCLENHR